MNTKTLYTKEKDGTIQKWYLWGWVGGDRIAVSTVKNAKFTDYTYCNLFCSRCFFMCKTLVIF